MELKFTTKEKSELLKLGNGSFTAPTLNKYLRNPKNFSGHERAKKAIEEAIFEYLPCAMEIINKP